MSTLKKYSEDPRNILNTALHFFRAKRTKTSIVEGMCDKRFLQQWLKKDSKIRFDGFNGKSLVEQVYLKSQAKPFDEYDFLYFFADIDFDAVSKKEIFEHPRFIYNVYSGESKRALYNDLEIYLINTSALEKLLANLDLAPNYAAVLREKVEKASRAVGRLRAADRVLQAKEKLSQSVLNGLEVRGAFFYPDSLTVNVRALEEVLPRWSNYPRYTDELIDLANEIDRENPAPWALSRGHDVTEMLSLHLESLGCRGYHREKLELMLRLACEASSYGASPMGQKLISSDGAACFLAFS
jgi:hypothetical protein